MKKSKLTHLVKNAGLSLALALALTCGLTPAISFAAEEPALQAQEEASALAPLSNEGDHYHNYNSTGHCTQCNRYNAIADFIDLQIPGATFMLLCDANGFGLGAYEKFVDWRVTNEGLLASGYGDQTYWITSEPAIQVFSPQTWALNCDVHEKRSKNSTVARVDNQTLFRSSFEHNLHPRLTYSVPAV